MIFSFSIARTKLTKILPFCGSHIDMLYTGNVVVLCSEDGQSSMNLTCPAISLNRDEIVGIRVSTALLHSICITGRVQVEVTDDDISLSFFGEESSEIYKTIVPRQMSYADLDGRLDIMSRASQCEYLTFGIEKRLVRIASVVKSPFIVKDGFSYIYHNMSYVFSKSTLPDFSCDSELLKKCITLTDKFKISGDSLVFEDGDISIVLRKQKLPLVSDLGRIINAKSLKKYRLDLKKLTNLTTKIKTEDYDVRLNLSADKCFITSSSSRYEINVKVTDEAKQESSLDDMLSNLALDEKKEELNEQIKIPYWAIKMLGTSSEAVLYVKKKFSMIVFDKVCVCIGGGFLVEK